jgi:hypothetical protein
VIRGGSWNNNARNCRSANRNNNNPDNRNNNIGFRLVRLFSSPDQWMLTADPRTKSRPLHKGQKADTRPGLVTGMAFSGEHHGRVLQMGFGHL